MISMGENMYRKCLVMLIALLVFSGTAFSEGYDAESFRKSLMEIDTVDVGVYRIELEKIISKAEAEGLGVSLMMNTALEAGVNSASLTSAAVKFYPASDVVALAILGGGDPVEIINLAIMSDADPGEIEAGALAAGVDPVEAATLVSTAKSLLIDSGEGVDGDTGAEEGDNPFFATPADDLDAGSETGSGEPEGASAGAAAPRAVGVIDNVGGDTPAEASPS